MYRSLSALIAILLWAGALPSMADSREDALDSAGPGTDTNDVQRLELEKVMQDDDAAMAEIDKWIRDNDAFAAQGAGQSKAELNARIMARLQTVRTNYEGFLTHYPTNADGHLAFASFLNDIGQDQKALGEYKEACQLNPNSSAAWNDLANFYGDDGPITNAFADYEKAIQLDPSEPVYYQNMATTVYLFRKDARQYYNINEQQVFDKALALYQKAVQLDPDNFVLMTDYAESYYGIKPLRTNDALIAWTNALKIARDEFEREGVYIHLARIKIAAGRFAEAQAHLDAVTNSEYDTLKERLEKTMAERKKGMPSFFDQPFAESQTAFAPTNHNAVLTNPPVSPSGQKTP